MKHKQHISDYRTTNENPQYQTSVRPYNVDRCNARIVKGALSAENFHVCKKSRKLKVTVDSNLRGKYRHSNLSKSCARNHLISCVGIASLSHYTLGTKLNISDASYTYLFFFFPVLSSNVFLSLSSLPIFFISYDG